MAGILLFLAIFLQSCIELCSFRMVSLGGWKLAASKRLLSLQADPVHWDKGLKFSCTGCGKCCLNEGEVWFDVNEFTELVNSLHLPAEDVLDAYAEETMGNWVKVKSKHFPIGGKQIEGCVFLSEVDQRSCTIYEQRPLQCRSYPFWPELLKSKKRWKEEAVVPANATGRHWSEAGGCEGIDHPQAAVVPAQAIHRTMDLLDMYTNSFKLDTHEGARERLLENIAITQRVLSATKQWIEKFVIGYSLCPHAQSAYAANRVRYRVCLSAQPADVLDMLTREVLYMLTHPKEEVETTMLMLPFAFSAFKVIRPPPSSAAFPSTRSDLVQEFREYAHQLKESTLPKMLVKYSVFETAKDKSRTELQVSPVPLNTITLLITLHQLACFHPCSTSGGPSVDPAVYFVKRSPFPTICLLRGDGALAADQTDRNAKTLQDAGHDHLMQQFQSILGDII